MRELLGKYLDEHILIAVALYVVLAVGEQISNGIFSTKFVIKDLTDIFVWVFGQLSIKMYCEGSQENEFAQMLKEVSGYTFDQQGKLILLFKFDTGSMIFEQITALE